MYISLCTTHCIGGPDMEKWKCNRSELVMRQVKNIDAQLDACCVDIFKKNRLGVSESIHSRHMRGGKIPVSFARFPVFLTRRRSNQTCSSECFRLYKYHFKEYMFMFGSKLYPWVVEPSLWPDSRSRAISSRDVSVCVMMDEATFAWAPKSAYDLHQAHSIPPLNYSQSLYGQQAAAASGLLPDPRDLQVWRVHPTWNIDSCLTYSNKFKNMSWSECIDHRRYTHSTLRFDVRQLFSLRVDPHNQAELDMQTHKYTQSLTPTTTRVTSTNSTRVMIHHYEGLTLVPKGGQIMCFTVLRSLSNMTSSSWSGAEVGLKECLFDKDHPTQMFKSVVGIADGSHPSSTVGFLQLAADPSLCIFRAPHRRASVMSNEPESGLLKVGKCHKEQPYSLLMFEFELIPS